MCFNGLVIDQPEGLLIHGISAQDVISSAIVPVVNWDPLRDRRGTDQIASSRVFFAKSVSNLIIYSCCRLSLLGRLEAILVARWTTSRVWRSLCDGHGHHYRSDDEWHETQILGRRGTGFYFDFHCATPRTAGELTICAILFRCLFSFLTQKMIRYRSSLVGDRRWTESDCKYS